MGKRSQKKSNALAKSKKLKQRYKNKILTRKELEKISLVDQIAYLHRPVKVLHPMKRLLDGKVPRIGDYYNCLHCAKSAVFGDGYVSEDYIEDLVA